MVWAERDGCSFAIGGDEDLGSEESRKEEADGCIPASGFQSAVLGVVAGLLVPTV